MSTEALSSLDQNQVVFPKLGIDITVNSTAFEIGNVSIQWYGILITLGLVLALVYCFTQVKKYGLHPDGVLDAVIGGIIGAIIGARAYYVLLNWDNYAGNWKAIFSIRQGGLAIYGGIIGAVAVGCLVAKLRHVRILPLLDLAGIGFLLGQGIGRWGNFFNQEAFGTNTDSIFGMSGGQIQSWIQNVYPTTTYAQNFGTTLDPSQPVHPCFLYESFWCLLGFALLVLFAKKIRRFDGQIFLIYIGWYGLERAFVEGLRTDSLVIGNVRISQMVAILCVVASIVLQIIIGNKVKRLGSDYQLYKDTAESKLLLAAAAEGKSLSAALAELAKEDESTTDTDSDPDESEDTEDPEDEQADIQSPEAEEAEETDEPEEETEPTPADPQTDAAAESTEKE